MTRLEPRVTCPCCGGDDNNHIRRLVDASTHMIANCPLCKGMGRVFQSVGAEWEVEQFEAFKRGKGKR